MSSKFSQEQLSDTIIKTDYIQDKVQQEINLDKTKNNTERGKKLKEKYPNSKYPPKSDCKFCNGVGERPHKTTCENLPCYCIFIDHSDCEWVGKSLSELAKQELAKLKKKDKENANL